MGLTWKDTLVLTALALAAILLVPIVTGYMVTPAEWR